MLRKDVRVRIAQRVTRESAERPKIRDAETQISIEKIDGKPYVSLICTDCGCQFAIEVAAVTAIIKTASPQPTADRMMIAESRRYAVIYRQSLRRNRKKMYLVYVSYPYSEDPKRTTEEVKTWAQEILAKSDDLVLLVPHFVFDAIWEFPDGYTHPEVSEQELALIKRMDIFAYDPKRVSTGVRWELSFAKTEGVPILTLEELRNGKRP